MMVNQNLCSLSVVLLSLFVSCSTHSRSADFGDDSRPDLWTGNEKYMVLLRCNVVIHRHPVLIARWNNNSTDFWIELTGETAGWMAFGISPGGEMEGSDILFGWCDDTTGQCYAQDRGIDVDLAQQRVNLTRDRIQDWRLISGHENGSHTIITAIRRLVTNDPLDRPFTERIIGIYALGQFDPDVSTGEVTKHVYRASSRLNVLNPAQMVATGQTDMTQDSVDENIVGSSPTISKGQSVQSGNNGDSDYQENKIGFPNSDSGLNSVSSSFGRGNAWRTSSSSSSSQFSSWTSRNFSRNSFAANTFGRFRTAVPFVPTPPTFTVDSASWATQSTSEGATQDATQEATQGTTQDVTQESTSDFATTVGDQPGLGTSWSMETTTESSDSDNEVVGHSGNGDGKTSIKIGGSWGGSSGQSASTSATGGFLDAVAKLIGLARWISNLAVNGSVVISSSQSLEPPSVPSRRHGQ